METLKEYDLKYVENDDPNRLEIDFSIADAEDNVAWVWGESIDDLEWECNHPDNCIEYDDDETVGECLICGATCDWHYQVATDGGYTIKERIPSYWHEQDKVGGVVNKILSEAGQ